MNNHNRIFGPQYGFTLIELLVVIAIIGILSSVVLSSLNSARATARDSTRVQMAKQLQTALEMYKNDHGTYPVTGSAPHPPWRGGTVGCLGGHGFGDDGYIPGLVPKYISVLPEDPRPQVGGNDRCLLYRSDGTDYKLLFYQTFEVCNPGFCPLQDPIRPVQRSSSIFTPGAQNW